MEFKFSLVELLGTLSVTIAFFSILVISISMYVQATKTDTKE
ncbi:hypothetical protein CLV91_1773 [Maribacter vaceletii]|uniref:Uncharacterized protein n=1 Tax=Maribacter vaceletii TaxID=1206816 RepID=A0A495E900_9FLAO|nr:hypothetical protein [Maribacter vaceletii]RKR13059.1 hypothetical protein CLV91_1773 [Maribacter vaceletii]